LFGKSPFFVETYNTLDWKESPDVISSSPQPKARPSRSWADFVSDSSSLQWLLLWHIGFSCWWINLSFGINYTFKLVNVSEIIEIVSISNKYCTYVHISHIFSWYISTKLCLPWQHMVIFTTTRNRNNHMDTPKSINLVSSYHETFTVWLLYKIFVQKNFGLTYSGLW